MTTDQSVVLVFLRVAIDETIFQGQLMTTCRQSVFSFTLTLLTLLATTATLRAQPLADRVPSDAVLYIGWAGVETLGDAYTQSHFHAVLHEAGGLDFINRLKTIATNMAAQGANDPSAQRVIADVTAVWDIAYRHPCALWVSPVDGQSPRVALAIQAGTDADKLFALFSKMIQADLKDGQESPATVKRIGDLVLVANGYPDGTPILAGAENAMSKNAALVKGLGQVDRQPAGILFVNGDQLWESLEKAVDPSDLDAYQRSAGALGHRGFHSLTATCAFEGKGWKTMAFIDIPADARGGLPALLTSSFLKVDTFKVAPRNATWVAGYAMDPTLIWDLVHNVAAAENPQALGKMQENVANMDRQVGISLEKTIKGLGNQWTLYSNAGGDGVLPDGVVVALVNHCRDTQTLDQTLTKLEAVAKAMTEQQARINGQPPQVIITSRKVNDLVIHQLVLPMTTVEWAITQDKLIIASGSGITPALRQLNAKDSILDSPAFAPLAKSITQGNATSVTMSDVPRTAPLMYQTLGMILPMFQYGIAQSGGGMVSLALPPLEQLLPHLSIVTSGSYVDAQGLHAWSKGNFPGEVMLSPGGVSTAGLGAGILLPALGAARRTARQMQDLTQVRGIIQGCILYALDNNDHYPDNIYKLIEGNYVTLEYLISPSSKTKIPKEFDSWSADKKRTWINDNCSYVLIPNLVADTDSERIAAFTKLQHGGGGGIAIGYNDNHVEWTKLDEARKLIKAQTGRSLEAWSGLPEKEE